MFIRKKYKSIDDLIDYIFNGDYSSNFSIICKFDNARLVLKSLIKRDELMPFFIRMEDPEWDGYDNEFIISVFENDVFCERFYRDKYIHTGDGAVFLLQDCNKECVDHVHSELEHWQLCIDVELSDHDYIDDGDIDVAIDSDGDTIKIDITLAQEYADAAQRLFPNIAHILDSVFI